MTDTLDDLELCEVSSESEDEDFRETIKRLIESIKSKSKSHNHSNKHTTSTSSSSASSPESSTATKS